jgi:hypothetical protein
MGVRKGIGDDYFDRGYSRVIVGVGLTLRDMHDPGHACE